MDVTRGQLLPVGKLPFKKRVMSLALGMASVGMIGQLHAAPYVEPGRAGQPDSWRSPEFKADWGLGAINAQDAYAAGYSGKGVKLGIFDQPVYAQHPEFNSPNKVITLTTSGIREYTDPYIPVKAGDAFIYDGSPSAGSDGKLGSHGTHVGGIAGGNRDGGPMHGVAYDAQIIKLGSHGTHVGGIAGGNRDGGPMHGVAYDAQIIKLGSHGTHVGGIAGGNRDGGPMHGVAYDAQIIMADNGDPGPEDGIIRGNDGAVYKAGWDALAASGARIINNSWGIGITDKFRLGGRDPAYPHFTVDDAQKQFDQIVPLLDTKAGGAYSGAIESARSGIVTIFAAGNDYNLNNPDAIAGLAHFVPDIAPNWITVASLQQNPDTTSAIPYTLSTFSSRCGYAASFCVSAPGTGIYSAVIGGTTLDNMTVGYGNKSGTSMAAPHVAGSAAVLMERFPYMTGAQVAGVLKSTATDLGAAGVDELYGWGMINLHKAIDGPGMFIADADIPQALRVAGSYGDGQFVADLPGVGALIDAGNPTERRCTDASCGLDIWRNDIGGHGGLTKQGIGTLVLTGANTYSGPTAINQGLLAVNGSLSSAVTVNQNGVLGGSGQVGALNANAGGTVAPGNSIGTLNVAGNVTFEPGATYAVELSPTQSDRIVAGGKATLKGGTVTLALENNPALLSRQQAGSLLGQQFSILQAAGGVEGQFASVLPNYLFIGGQLDYSATAVQLGIERTAASFASVALTPNQRAVAAAAEGLSAGNAVYEGILLSPSVTSARQAYQQLSGEIHPAIATQLINDSRHVRDAVGDRLRQHDLYTAGSEAAGQNSVWVKALGAWGKTDAGSSNAQSTTSLGGMLIGADGLITEATRVGLFTGYSHSGLNMGDGTHANASTDSYHLGAYVGHEIDALRLSAGGAYSWNRTDVKRDVQFADIDAKQKTKRDAGTAQVFTEAAYRIQLSSLALEPFANLTYVHVSSDSFHEKGGAAALKGRRDNREAVLSTLGLRAAKTFTLNSDQKMDVAGSLGWQHNLNAVGSDEDLSFVAGSTPFSVHSVSLARDAAVVGAQVGVALGKDTRLELDYNGQLSNKDKTHGVGLNLSWQF